jgi:hypothetical protein
MQWVGKLSVLRWPYPEQVGLVAVLRMLQRVAERIAMRGELLRFVTDSRHPPYGHRSGLFQVAYAIWREHRLPELKRAELRALLDWFNDHLEAPERFAASRRPHAKGTAISWVRASAHEHVSRIRRVAALVEGAGMAVHELRTKRPGYIVYEDTHQVVALPFADTPR